MVKNKVAVVVGGGIAGLLTARVLANHFKKVTICEKDDASPTPFSVQGMSCCPM